jgi:hypothetical protein
LIKATLNRLANQGSCGLRHAKISNIAIAETLLDDKTNK